MSLEQTTWGKCNEGGTLQFHHGNGAGSTNVDMGTKKEDGYSVKRDPSNASNPSINVRYMLATSGAGYALVRAEAQRGGIDGVAVQRNPTVAVMDLRESDRVTPMTVDPLTAPRPNARNGGEMGRDGTSNYPSFDFAHQPSSETKEDHHLMLVISSIRRPWTPLIPAKVLTDQYPTRTVHFRRRCSYCLTLPA